jgi:dCTP deaminase
VLAQTSETLSIPRDLTAVCLGKSTYARCGVVVNASPAEAEWRGRLTLEISNTAPVPVILYPGEGIAQMLFWRAEAVCEVSYADRRGRYQDQRRVTPPFVRSSPLEKDMPHA